MTQEELDILIVCSQHFAHGIDIKVNNPVYKYQKSLMFAIDKITAPYRYGVKELSESDYVTDPVLEDWKKMLTIINDNI